MIQAATHLSHPKYRPDIDGLRALAVLSVVTFHAFPTLLSGGFTGVDVFFVISGYLISTIIIQNTQAGSFSFPEFYARRIKRIFPALLVMLIACYAFGWFALLADEYRQLGKHIAAGAGFVANLVFWQESGFEGGYFDTAAGTKPLLHLWSLGIEEQFYIVWPLFVWLAVKRKYAVLAIILACLVGSFYLNISGVDADPVATFYAPQTRFWELLCGSLLAWLTIYRRDLKAAVTAAMQRPGLASGRGGSSPARAAIIANAVSTAGICLLAFGFWHIAETMSFPGFWAVVPVMGAVLVIAAGPQAFLNRHVLSNRVAVWFGLISYPLYLWHWPLLSFARILQSEVPSASIRLGAVALAILLAWLTYELVEMPLRSSVSNRWKTPLLAAAMTVVGLVGLGTYLSDGFPFRHGRIEQNVAQVKYEESFYQNDFGEKAYPDFNGFYRMKTADAPPQIMIVGDSLANRLIMGLSELTDAPILQLSHHACPGLSGLAIEAKADGREICSNYAEKSLAVARDTQTITDVIIEFRGPLYIPAPAKQHIYWKDQPEISDPKAAFELSLRSTFDMLLARNKHVIFVYANPSLNFDPELCGNFRPFRLQKSDKPKTCRIKRNVFEKRERPYRELMTKILADYPMVKSLDSADVLCDAKFCYAALDGKLLYKDRGHLSLAGSQLMARQLLPLLSPGARGQ